MTGQVEFALAALAVVLVAEPLSRRLRVPVAVLLVIAGIAYGLAPGPNVALEPSVILTLILPPLLYSTALQASLFEIRTNLRAVGSLSVGLVFATAFLVGLVLYAVVPGLPFALALALGAAVAPPDPVAALAIGRRAGLPSRLTPLIEGEGLLNDATALTTYQVAVAAVAGGSVSAGHAASVFVLDVVVGLAVGVVLAKVVRVVSRRVTDPLLDNGISLAVPFAAYVVAETLHGSGVLAVVVAGLMLGHTRSGWGSVVRGPAALQTRAVWRLVDLLLEGFVFLLIGQQLPTVIDGLDAYRSGTLAAAAGFSVLAVLLVRPVWLVVGNALGLLGSRRFLGRREIVAMSWSGTRGVITLAAAFGLPLTAAGARLPDRDLLLFCAYVIVLVTLVGQGLTLGPLLGALGLPTADPDEVQVRARARVAAVKAGLARLDELVGDDAVTPRVADGQRALLQARLERYGHRLDVLGETDLDTIRDIRGQVVDAHRELLDAEREELTRWRDAGRLSDRSLRALDRELDVEESRG